MTSAAKAGQELARRTTRAQRLPLKVDDPRTVAVVAEMFGPPKSSAIRRKDAVVGGGADG